MTQTHFTPGEWEYAMFTKPDGTPIVTVQDVADTVAASARHSDISELYGVAERGTTNVICYTGNGPTRAANACAIAAVPAMYAALEKIVEMNRQHAHDQYADADKAESWSCVVVARAALAKARGGT